MKFLILLVACACLVSCARQGLSEEETTNAEISLTKLFTHDECTVYRFMDAGRYHYFAKCRDSASISQTLACGRGCEYEDVIVTVPVMEEDHP